MNSFFGFCGAAEGILSKLQVQQARSTADETRQRSEPGWLGAVVEHPKGPCTYMGGCQKYGPLRGA